MLTPDHAALRIDNGGNPRLYDPDGSYCPNQKMQCPEDRQGDVFYGKAADLDSYMAYQTTQMSRIEVFYFSTTAQEEAEIAKRIDQFGPAGSFECSASVTGVLNGIGPFRNLGLTAFPWILRSTLKDIQGEIK